MVLTSESFAMTISPRLFRGIINNEEDLIPLTPAGRQASRLAACPDGSFAFATGQSVYKIKNQVPRKRARHSSDPEVKKEVETNDKNNGVAEIVSSAIADDYLVPKTFDSLEKSRFATHSTHWTEVQSVTADATRVASTDAYGRGIVSFESAGTGNDKDYHESKSFILSPISVSGGEPGWSGVTLRRKDASYTAICRQFYRDFTVYDHDVPVRTIYNILPPRAIGFAGDDNGVVVAEGSDICYYDIRAGEKGGCMNRSTVGNGNLLCMDVSEDSQQVAVGGMDRILHVFDLRTMQVRDRWSSCLKYECSGTVFSGDRDGMAYVCSVDNELACGAWDRHVADAMKTSETSQSLMISGANTKSPRRAFGFRADVRITGIAKRKGEVEEVAVMSEAGAFYLLQN